MKRFLIATTALALTLTGTMASAQDYNHDRRDQYQDRGDRHDRDDRGDRRDDRRGYRDDRGDRGRDFHGRYARGQRYRGDGVYFNDYRRYGYRAPPRGYRYYRTNDGEILLAAVATGVIASVIANNQRGY